MVPRIVSLDISIFEEDPEVHFDIISLINACGVEASSSSHLRRVNLQLSRGDSDDFSSIGVSNGRIYSMHLIAEIMPSSELAFSDELYLPCRCKPQKSDCGRIYGGSIATRTVDRWVKKKLHSEDRIAIMPLLL